MAETHRPDDHTGRPSPQWLQNLAADFVAKIEDRELTLTVAAAEALLADRIKALAAVLHITERSARAYLDSDALDAMADSLVDSVADEDPGKDLLQLPRNAALRVGNIGRLVAALAQCAHFFTAHQSVDEDLSLNRGTEIIGLLSTLGLIQAAHESGDTVFAPRALFVRISRILNSVADLAVDPNLSRVLRNDAFIADAGSKAHRLTSHSAAVSGIAAHAEHHRPNQGWDPEAVAAELDELPWVVWQLTLNDPHRLAGEDIAERTKQAAEKVADLYGCIYEYCVDDDETADGTKYYKWRIALKQSEHQTPIRSFPAPRSPFPQVIGELYDELCTLLPAALHQVEAWSAGPDLYATHVRNTEDRR